MQSNSEKIPKCKEWNSYATNFATTAYITQVTMMTRSSLSHCFACRGTGLVSDSALGVFRIDFIELCGYMIKHGNIIRVYLALAQNSPFRRSCAYINRGATQTFLR